MGTIRFLLALSVLIVHSSPILGVTILPGYLAVQVFYIISGFYMTLVYREKYSLSKRPLYLFFSNRILRLYPLYLIVIFMTIILSLVFGVWLGWYGKLQYYFDYYHHHSNSLGQLSALIFFNLILIGQDIITFFSFSPNGYFYFNGLQGNIQLQEFLFIPIAWTVSVELFFYLVVPFTVNKSIQTIIGFIVSVLLLRLLLFFFFDAQIGFAIYRFAPTELFWFLLGILSYRLHKIGYLPNRRFGAALWLLFLFSLFTYRYLEVDLIIFCLTFFTVPSIFYYFSRHSWDRLVGELTYPLYISHCFFLLIVGANSFPQRLGTGLPLFIFTLSFALFAYYFILRKIDHLRNSRLKQK